ncbi:MAG: hypothetical protein M1814_002221 [Vezdaea aestivalis]|nr:MAG: hypothetical protein M1814_002221 [Vezdaea aestivalis]
MVARDLDALDKAVIELNALNLGKAGAICADISKYEDCKRLVREFSAQEQELNILINNAAANHGASFEHFPDSAFGEVLKLNLHRAFTLAQLFLPSLVKSSKKGDPSRIINIGSVDGERVPAWKNFAYSASKAGLHHLSRIMAWHLGRRGITSNTLVIGPFEVGMMASTLKNVKAKNAILEGIATGRFGSAEDIAGACIFLGSRAGAHVNGATISIDGGVLIRAKL